MGCPFYKHIAFFFEKNVVNFKYYLESSLIIYKYF